MAQAASLDVVEVSRSEGTFDGLEALPDHWVVAAVQYLSATRLHQQTGPIDKSVPQGLGGLKRPDRPSFAIRGTPIRGAGLHRPHQVGRVESWRGGHRDGE